MQQKTDQTNPDLDPVLLEIIWSRLIAICDQSAATLTRTAFSTLIRECNDYTCVLLDKQGDSLAENQGTAGSFAGCLPRTMRIILDLMPLDSWFPGDVVITNDPWIGTGHKPDVVIIKPVFSQNRIVGFAANVAHWADISGTIWSASCNSVFEEGIMIPPTKNFTQGILNKSLMDFIEGNVRLPKQVSGDFFAQIASLEKCADLLIELLDEYQLPDLQEISKELQSRAEASMRLAIKKIPNGKYESYLDLDGFENVPLHIKCTVEVMDDHIIVDYGGSSPQTNTGGINCVPAYTAAWTAYTLKSILDPQTYKNEGSYKPFSIKIPEGSILNATYPAPVNARQLVGRCVCSSVLIALQSIIPTKVIADSGSNPDLMCTFYGKGLNEEPFVFVLCIHGGMGASAHGDGISCSGFPANSGSTPIEMMESNAPLIAWKREIRTDSGGPGKYRGGYGQELILEMTGNHQIELAMLSERVNYKAQGFSGGLSGSGYQLGWIDSDQALPSKGLLQVKNGEFLHFITAGGGGFGNPSDRSPTAVVQDLKDEIISETSATEDYKIQT